MLHNSCISFQSSVIVFQSSVVIFQSSVVFQSSVIVFQNGVTWLPVLASYLSVCCRRQNISSFCACARLLANLSGYQYTRRVWRRETFDLLFEPRFFYMQYDAMQHWATVIDNLMTHDRTTFRDFLGNTHTNRILVRANLRIIYSQLLLIDVQCGCKAPPTACSFLLLGCTYLLFDV